MHSRGDLRLLITISFFYVSQSFCIIFIITGTIRERILHSNISVTGPSKVTSVLVTKSLEDGNFISNVSWTTPQSELPITEYEVEYRTSDTESWIDSIRLSVSTPANSTILTGLDAGVEYIIRVRASSEIGAGAWSEEHRVRTDDSECL